MNGWYDQAMETVAAADAVWSALPARIDLLAAETQRVRSLAHSVGVRPGEHPSGDDLEQLVGELTELRARTVSDPLAFWLPRGRAAPGRRPDTAALRARPARRLEDIRREVEAVLHVRDDAEHRLMRLRDVLSRADRTLTEARAARGRGAGEDRRLRGARGQRPGRRRCTNSSRRPRSSARGAQWHRLSPLLDGLEEHADEELLRARDSLTAVTAPLAVRAELRGRLDAYRAKVARLGMAEDPLLIERYDQARRLLWSAPCDLRRGRAGGAALPAGRRGDRRTPVPRPTARSRDDRRAEPAGRGGRTDDQAVTAAVPGKD